MLPVHDGRDSNARPAPSFPPRVGELSRTRQPLAQRRVEPSPGPGLPVRSYSSFTSLHGGNSKPDANSDWLKKQKLSLPAIGEAMVMVLETWPDRAAQRRKAPIKTWSNPVHPKLSNLP